MSYYLYCFLWTNSIFNVGSDSFSSINELATAVSEVMKVELSVKHLDKRQEVTHAYADHKRFDMVFNPGERRSLVDGLAEMAAWVKSHGARQSKTFENIEISKNLPSSWQKPGN